MKHKFRIPFIEQHQKTECGLCCVAMVSSYYYHEVSVKELTNIQETGRDGTSFLQLSEILTNIGFETKAFKIPKDQSILLRITTPSIALWDSKHFIVIEKVSNKYCYIIDPEIGKILYTHDEFFEHFSGYLLSITDSKKVQKKRYHEDVKPVFKLIFQPWKYFIPLAAFTLISYIVTFLLPLAVSQIINNVSDKSAIPIKFYFWLVTIFSLVYFVVLLGQKLTSISLTSHIDSSLNTGIISRLFQLPYKFYDNRSRGDLVYSLNGLTRIRELFTNQFLLGMLDVGLSICIMLYLFRLDLLIFTVSLVLLCINFSTLFFTRQTLDRKNKMFFRSQNEVQNKQIEIVYAMMGIKMEGFEIETYQQWLQTYSKYYYKYRSSQAYSNLISTFFEIISFVSPFVLLIIAVYLYSINQFPIGIIFTVYSFSTILFGKVNNIFNTILAYISSKTFILRANDILNETIESQGGQQVLLQGSIKLDNVSFSYTKDSPIVLNGVDIEINAGEKIAIVGSSGSGKSTLSKLLIGLYRPIKGNIFYDGINEKKIDKKILRKQIGIVPQDMTLFNKTIFENIVGEGNFSQQDVINACKIANIHDEIMNMPMNYNTLISEMGMNLSGGQRQRLILARAIIKKPKIILLDEATSYLDNINEKQIMDSFKENNITIIVIAHRLSTIIDSDKIFVLESGTIKESGSHSELMGIANGIYNKMYQVEN